MTRLLVALTLVALITLVWACLDYGYWLAQEPER